MATFAPRQTSLGQRFVNASYQLKESQWITLPVPFGSSLGASKRRGLFSVSVRCSFLLEPILLPV
jgi:hypothetical protein